MKTKLMSLIFAVAAFGVCEFATRAYAVPPEGDADRGEYLVKEPLQKASARDGDIIRNGMDCCVGWGR